MEDNPNEFIEALEQVRFKVGRKLSDGTPVTGFTAAERAVIAQYYPLFMRQERTRDRLAVAIGFPPGANAYTTMMLALWQFLKAEADARSKLLLWVSTTGTMDARASLHSNSLCLLSAVKFVTWEKLALLERKNPEMVESLMIVGDVDYEQGHQGRLELSDASSVGHAAVISTIKRVAQNPRIPLVFLHREGWVQAFDPIEFLAGAPTVVPAAAVASKKAVEPAACAQPAAKPKSGGCFIATACCGSPDDPLVRDLRRFRDDILESRAPGRLLAAIYARSSPPVANLIGRCSWSRAAVRHSVVRPLAWVIRSVWFRS